MSISMNVKYYMRTVYIFPIAVNVNKKRYRIKFYVEYAFEYTLQNSSYCWIDLRVTKMGECSP